MRWSFASIVLVPRGQQLAPPSAAERRRVFAWARDAGFSGVELTAEWLDFFALSDRALHELATEIDDAGLRVSGLNVPRCLFTCEPHAGREFARVERALTVAPLLGADVVNIALSLPLALNAERPPLRGADAPAEEHARAAKLVARLGRRARAAGVTLVVELHDDGLLDTPEFCLQLLERVNLPNVGINPDVANLCRDPGPLPDWRRAFELLAPRTANWHVKNYRCAQPVSVPDGDIDYAVVWEIMRAAGYDGWVSIESRFGDVLAEQRTALAYLKSLAALAATQHL